ncbi:cell division cycle-associated protein 4 [Pseudophryne corroboree]|uniref:cell division cycle-associated protein 4 n=1 Tax=Pseudophryne corroboree TaxID=495146 RepID=UPI003081D3C6
MFTRGIKRKCFDPEEIDEPLADLKAVPSYTLERQSLLDMSLVKLQLCHMLVEPNLCRSVLIANTVRQIQEEMTQDGSWQIFEQQSDPPLDRLVSTEILCRSSKEQDEEKPIDDNYITYSEELEVQETEVVSELPTDTSVKGLQNSSATFWEVENPHENRANLQKSIDHIFETLENRNANSMDDLFSEVDTSYYDLDTVLTGMMGNSKLGHCEMLETLSSQAVAPIHCKAELNEIDHIVEILVES